MNKHKMTKNPYTKHNEKSQNECMSARIKKQKRQKTKDKRKEKNKII